MAMTKKRISGILLAVALFVGVFAATPAFAATTTTAKGVTIDWTDEKVQFNDLNLTVDINGTPIAASKDGIRITDLIPAAGAADAKMTIHDVREDADKNEVVTIPARPEAPKFVSPSIAASSPQVIATGVTGLKVNGVTAGYEYAIDGGAFSAASEFTNLKPNTTHGITARVAAVAGKSFASISSPAASGTTDDFKVFFINHSTEKIALKPGYTAYEDALYTKQLTSESVASLIGKTVYIKGTNGSTFSEVLARPVAPAAPKFIVSDTSISFDGDDAATLKFSKDFQTSVLADDNAATVAAADYTTPWANITNLPEGTTKYIAVRTPATLTAFASAPVLVKVTTLRKAPVMTIDGNYRIDKAAEKIFFGSDVTPALEANTKADFTGTAIKTGDSISAVIDDAAKDATHKIFFRFPATSGLAASAVSVGETMPVRSPNKPVAPVVVATEEAITITNTYASNVEFSIDGISWTTKTVFTAKDNKVEDGKDYTVYARFAGDSANVASEASKTATKTPAKKVVTFKSGATVVATSKFVNGAALVYPAAPKKTGYRFAGWDVAAGTAVTDDMTVNAQWKVIRGLKTIRKSAGRMTPAFKISQKTYKVVLSKSTSSVKLVAKRRSTAQVVKTYYKGKVYKTYYKTVKLSRGASTTVKFYVKAADGKTTTYYVKVVRK